jgi:hypothetical protein
MPIRPARQVHSTANTAITDSSGICRNCNNWSDDGVATSRVPAGSIQSDIEKCGASRLLRTWSGTVIHNGIIFAVG